MSRHATLLSLGRLCRLLNLDRQVHGVILENTLLSIRTLVPLIMPHLKPFLAVPSLLTEQWDATKTLPSIKPETPMLLLAGQKDELVVPVQMREIKAIREKAAGKVKWVEFPNGTHSTLRVPVVRSALGL